MLPKMTKPIDHAQAARSLEWLRYKIQLIRKTTATPIGKLPTDQAVKKFVPGYLYFFGYDAKTKADLPYWDQFPLVLVLKILPDGFIGLNFHYLPFKYRLRFMEKLMQYAKFTPQNEMMRIRISYEILSATERLSEFKPCIKRYLKTNIRTRLLPVQADEVPFALAIPVHNFKGASAKKVWEDSMNQIKEENGRVD